MLDISNTDSLKSAGKQFRILSLDGGGVRGVIPLTILTEIEKRTGKKIAQMFDLIVGNSTGGIIALALAALGDKNEPKYTAQEILNLYLAGTPQIFKKSLLRSIYSGLGLWAPKYHSSDIDAMLNQFFGDLRLSQVACPAMVTSYSLTQDSPTFWTSYRAQQDSNWNIAMQDAAGATSAAPTYFAPKMIQLPNGTTTYEVDGGIYINDPETAAITEALSQNPDLTLDQIYILSIGTGQPKLKPGGQTLTNKGIIGWLKQVNLIDLMMNADAQLGQWEVGSFSSINRHRLQLNLDQKNIAMDDATPENLQSLQKISADFINESEDEMKNICELLAQVIPDMPEVHQTTLIH